MLIQFSVQNYRSIKDLVTLNLLADKADKEHLNNVFSIKNDNKLLKSCVIFGHNASGKSNILKAIEFCKDFTVNSYKRTQINEKINVNTFRFSTQSTHAPTHFEFVFCVGETIYKYGFEIKSNAIYKEWLTEVLNKTERNYFTREHNKLTFGKNKKGKFFQEGDELQQLKQFSLRDNSLYLSTVAQLINGPISQQILGWFDQLHILTDAESSRRNYEKNLYQKSKNKAQKEKIMSFIKMADVGIEDIFIEPIDVESLPAFKDMPNERKEKLLQVLKDKYITLAVHKKYDKDNQEVDPDVMEMYEESMGTNTFIGLVSQMIDVLETGSILIIDELDLHLHPLLTHKMLELFNSKRFNPKNAQLICTAHTTMLMKEILRRDQIWFIEKNGYGASELYSLDEYTLEDGKKVRNDASYDKNYLHGRYGAIPFLDEQHLLEQELL